MMNILRGAKNYPVLTGGLILMLGLLLTSLIGALFLEFESTRPGSNPLELAPSAEYPFGTDGQGRNSLAVTVYSIPLTLRVGFIAAVIGMAFGSILGFVGGYYGGIIDSIFKGAADIFITIPVLLILVVLAITITGPVDVNTQALVIASVSWMWPARTIRAQVLTMRERSYVSVASLSGASSLEIIFVEMMPNLLPFLTASFVAAMATALLTTIGMDALGLGPQNQVTLGGTVYWALQYSAPLRGIYWWWAPPVIVLGFVFISLYMISVGIDKIANPRLKKHSV